MINKITIKDIIKASEGWADYQCADVLIEASRMRTRLGIISEMMTNLPTFIINRDGLYHTIKIEDAKIKYARLRLCKLKAAGGEE